MRFILFASIFSFAVAAAVGSADNGETDFNIVEDDTTKLIERQDKKVNIYTNNINYRPYKRTLSKDECDDIVNAYISVLTKKKYKGKSPKETSQNYVVKNYVLRSGSINSLISKNNDVNPIPTRPDPHCFTQQTANQSPRSASTSATAGTSGSKKSRTTRPRTSRPARSTLPTATSASGSGGSAVWATAATTSKASTCSTSTRRRRLPGTTSSSTALLGASTPTRSSRIARLEG
jgi:hypothetical protein